jgi:septal ring factor EnvC (AmiA/AmiB activator)
MENLSRKDIVEIEQLFTGLKTAYEKSVNQQLYEIKQEKENYKVENNALKQRIALLETELTKNRENGNHQLKEMKNMTETVHLLQSNRRESLREIQNELSSTETLSKTRYEVSCRHILLISVSVSISLLHFLPFHVN